MASLAGGEDAIVAATGMRQGPTSVLAKLLWLQRHQPHALKEASSLLLGAHAYVCSHLIGRPARVVDSTTLSTTGLATCPNANGVSYASDLLHSLGLSHWLPLLPDILPPTQSCGALSVEAAERMGARHLAGIPVFHSCGDLGASAVGCGAGLPGTEYIYLGTSGWVAGSFPNQPSRHPASQPHDQGSPRLASQPLAPPPPLAWSQGVFTLAHPDPSLVFRTAPIMTAGGNYKWALNTLLNIADVSEAAFHAADVAALSVPAGSGGLLYLPFLNGERCPFEDPNMRAAFIGVSAATTQSHMIRAVLEGVAFALLSAYGAMHTCSSGSRSTGDTAPLRIVGGGARYVGLISVGANHGICVQPTNRLPR
ncbi:hypothetical protein CLOM_g539 [Closterium sp. NIES-68]|nr:hypothetical protein CLOM_g539 [Closterium sp. NIES-68]